MSIPSPRGLISRDSFLQPDTRNSLGTNRTRFLKIYLLQVNHHQHSFANTKNLASASCGSVPVDTGRIAGRAGVLERTLRILQYRRSFQPGSFSLSCRRSLSSILYDRGAEESNFRIAFDKFADTSDFQCVGRQISRFEVCSCTGYLTHAMLWIKDVEVDKSVDDLVTSQSRKGLVFSSFEMLDAKIASALLRIISEQYCRRKINVEQQKSKHKTEFFEEDTLLT